MEMGNVRELLEVTEMLSVRIRVRAKHLEHHPDDRCPWGRVGGEAREGEAPPEGRLILGLGHCCHKKDQRVGKRGPGARGPQPVLLNPPPNTITVLQKSQHFLDLAQGSQANLSCDTCQRGSTAAQQGVCVLCLRR